MKKHLALMNIAKCVIPLNPPSKGEKDCCYPFLCQDIGRSRILFPPSEGGLRGMSLTNIRLRQKKVRILLPHQMKKHMTLLFIIAQTCQTVFHEIHPFQSFVTVSGGAVPPLIQLVQYGHYFAPTVDNNRFLR